LERRHGGELCHTTYKGASKQKIIQLRDFSGIEEKQKVEKKRGKKHRYKYKLIGYDPGGTGPKNRQRGYFDSLHLAEKARRRFKGSKMFARNLETGRFDIPVKAKEIEAQLKTLGYNIRTLKREKNGNVKDR